MKENYLLGTEFLETCKRKYMKKNGNLQNSTGMIHASNNKP
jgi:hypothetical protein